jgi:predicted nucleic acid-binding Zn ribbon protein
MTPRLRTKVIREWNPFAAEAVPASPSLAQIVPGVVKRLGLQQRLWESQLFTNWTEIVGDFNARICQPASLRNGRLIIHVTHPAYIQELRPHKNLFLQKIQQRLGKTSVRDIQFRVG